MSSEKTATQPVIASSSPQAYVATRLIPVCCVCGLIRDELGSVPGRVSWVTLGSYRKGHKVHSTDLRFTHTYCPDCLAQVQDRVREYFKAKGAETRTV
jgi:hypothetical protein